MVNGPVVRPGGLEAATDRPPRAVVVGAATRDVAADDPRGWRLGGGVTYSALALARLGIPTAALVGVDDEAATAHELALLTEAGVEVRLDRLARGPVFDNVETPTGRAQVGLSASDPVDPTALPPAWRSATGWVLAAIADELTDGWAAAIPDEAVVATGWQGLLRDIVPGERVQRRAPGPSPIVHRADIVGLSREDVPRDTDLADLFRLVRPGATIALTRGARGGIAMLAADGRPALMRRWSAVPTRAVVDPTGAGDVFLAGLIGARLLRGGGNRPIERGADLRLAATMSSLLLEAHGLAAVPTREAIRARLLEG